MISSKFNERHNVIHAVIFSEVILHLERSAVLRLISIYIVYIIIEGMISYQLKEQSEYGN